MDNRALSPVVGKLLAAGIAVLYITSATGLLLGGVVPEYRDAAGSKLGDRVLATAAGDIEGSLPATDGNVSVQRTRSLPRTIAGERYRLTLSNRTLHLDHPDDALDARAHLTMPAMLTIANDTWESGDPLRIRIQGQPPNRVLTLGEGD